MAAASASPVDSHNLHPFKHTLSAPSPRACSIPGPHCSGWTVEARHDIANASYREQSANELVLIDTEINRTEVHTAYRWAGDADNLQRYQLGIALPWISFSGGRTDSAISHWHDFFGLPNGNRDSRPDNAIALIYQRDGETLVDRSSALSGAGDIDLYWQSNRAQLANDSASILHAGVSIPTGNSKSLLSSGTLQLHGYWGWSSPTLAGNTRLFSRVGASYALGGGFLHQHRKDLSGFTTLGASVPVSSQLTLIAQWQLHSQIYDSELDSLGTSSSQVTIGLRSRAQAGINWSLYFTEDIDVNSAPDFGLGLAIGYSR